MRLDVGGLRIGRLPQRVIEDLLAQARAGEPTYAPVGATLSASTGAHEESTVVGHGNAAFGAAVDAVRTWVPQRGIGAEVFPPDQVVVEGATVLVVLRRGPVRVVAPDRIVAVIDEQRRFAFAYGTLPTHPERGEESFTVEHGDDDAVRVTIRVDAGPGTLPARLVAPVVRRLQHAALRGYLRAIADHVRLATTTEEHRHEPTV